MQWPTHVSHIEGAVDLPPVLHDKVDVGFAVILDRTFICGHEIPQSALCGSLHGHRPWEVLGRCHVRDGARVSGNVDLDFILGAQDRLILIDQR